MATTNTTVVDEVSFSIAAGEMLGIVGESGSGKSTVAFAILGHARRGLAIVGGSVKVDGRDLLRLSPDELRAARGSVVAHVAQDPASALNPGLRVRTQIRELYRKHGQPRDGDDRRLDAALREVGLEPSTASAFPHQLSGGQQQRVCLAMAFALQPSVIVLDEPTTGLDVSTQRLVLDKVASMCAAHGVAGILISHDLAIVGEVTDQVAVMYAGCMVEHGTTREVLDSPRHPYTRALLEALPDIDASQTLVGLGGQPPTAGARPAGCAFGPRCAFVVPACIDSPPPSKLLPGGRSVRCCRATDILEKVTTEVAPPRTTIGETLLRVRHLDASHGERQVLHDVSLELASGECLAVVGESGSGKTTLARCIAGLHEQWTGDIELEGAALPHSVWQRSDQTLRSVQYVFQSPFNSLNPRRSIRQIVEQPLLRDTGLGRDARFRRVVEALDESSLPASFLDRFPGDLSGGERQRVAIARAIVGEPDLLICDEVTSALDVSVQATVVEMLKDIQRQRSLAMIFVTHNLALVPSVASKVAVIKEGRIVEHGEVGFVLRTPQHDYTQRLLTDAPTLRRRGIRRNEAMRTAE